LETLKDFFKNGSDIGEKLFRARDYTPVPFLLLALLFERPRIGGVALGCFLIVFGELIRIYSVSFIGGISRTRKGSLGEKLVSEGAFSIVRNPLYVGNFFIIAGVSLFSSVPWLILLGLAFFVAQYHFIVQYEERLLEERFGEEFHLYKDSVPAWIPSKLPSLDEIQWPVSFSPALRSEKRTFTAIVAVVLLMVLRA
jgi:protein-S-isoprenylcysteine O-methyltransferase Ste14